MKLDAKALTLCVLAALAAAGAIGVSSRRAIHVVLVENLERSARARTSDIVQSMRIGLASSNERPLRKYLGGCLTAFGAVAAQALDARGQVVAVVGAGNDRLGPRHRLVIPVADERGEPLGALVLSFGIEGIVATESRIAWRIFVLTALLELAALSLALLLMRRLIESERKLRQSERLSALGRLAAGIAHELNNPLGSILGFAEATSEKFGSAVPELAYPLGIIRDEALRCTNLIKDLLTFARQKDSGLEEFDLNKAVAGTIKLIEAEARVRDVRCVTSLGAARLARGDRNQLQQVIINLCSNALDAMPRGGTLTLRTGSADERSSPTLFLEVEDTGTGIPDEIKSRIFDPFFTTKEVGKGTGLGLALVHDIVAKHHGSIELRSRPGLTAFRVVLPAADPR